MSKIAGTMFIQYTENEAIVALVIFFAPLSVSAAEDRNIFPYTDEANVLFNSYHVYEIAVLKKYAKPLLEKITPEDDEYAEAKEVLQGYLSSDNQRIYSQKTNEYRGSAASKFKSTYKRNC